MPDREPSWPMFKRVWRRAELTDRMIDELAVDPIIAARLDKGDAYREACANCIACSSPSDCRNWLDATERLPLPPDFCPNSKFFERCLYRKKDMH
jgi:hypothetical protein